MNAVDYTALAIMAVLILAALGILAYSAHGLLADRRRERAQQTEPAPDGDLAPWCVGCRRALRSGRERCRGTCAHCDAVATGRAAPWA